MTATPMQVHPVEVWDLLIVLGLGGRWGADEDNFLRFFAELRKPFEEVDWDFVFDMVADYLATGGAAGSGLSSDRSQSQHLGPVKWATPRQTCRDVAASAAALLKAAAGRQPEPTSSELARRHTPLRRLHVPQHPRSAARVSREGHPEGERAHPQAAASERVPMRAEEQAPLRPHRGVHQPLLPEVRTTSAAGWASS